MLLRSAHILGIVLWLWVGVVVKSNHTRVTSGSSGVVCEGGFRKCITRKATCVDGTCKCALGGPWKGNFACYPPGSSHAEIINDPTFRTFAQERVPFPVPCRYPMTHFRTTFIGWDRSTCEVVIHAYNIKHKGKYYVHGFDLALIISTLDPQDAMSAQVSFRMYGTAFQNTYSFSEYGSLQFSPDGPWNISEPPVSIQLPNTVIRARCDPYNNFVFVEVANCGFSVRLRPFDRAYGKKQVLLPGLGVVVYPGHDTEWLSLDTVLALVPSGEPSLEGIAQEYDLEQDDAFLVRLALSGTVQNQPDAAPECTTLTEVVRQCPDVQRRRSAFKTCGFLLKTTELTRCLDASTNGNIILGIFNQCLQSVCSADISECRAVQNKVARCRRTRQLHSIAAFLRPETCDNIV